jgi:hypothetical protein
MYVNKDATLVQLAQVQTRDDWKIVISKYPDEGYKLAVKQREKDPFGDYSWKFLKGAIILPSDQKAYEFAMKLLEVVSENQK